MKRITLYLIAAVFLFAGMAHAEDINIDAKNWYPKDASNAVDGGVTCIKNGSQPYLIFKDTLPVDTNKTYILSGEFKGTGATGAICHFGLQCLNDKEQKIHPRYINMHPYTDTELVAPCTYSDKVLKVKNASKWITGPYVCVAFEAKPKGEDLPNNNISRGWGVTKVEKKDTFWEITLKNPCGKEYPAGTKLREHKDSYLLNYVAGSLKSSDKWQAFSGKITGVTSNCGVHNMFRLGTKTVQIRFLLNYNKVKNAGFLFKNIKFTEVK